MARAFNRSGTIQAVALPVSKAFDRVWCAGHKLKSYGILGQIFGLLSSFHSNRWLVGGSGCKVFTRISVLARAI